MKDTEIWGKVGILRGIDYSGFYEISTFGNVRSIDRKIRCKNGRTQKRKGVLISQYKNETTGYMQVVLSYKGNERTFPVHELVMNTHNPNPNPEIYTDVNHIDEDKTNNRLENLEWTTHKENVNHGTARERQVQSLKNKFIPIVQLDFDGNIVNVYYRRDNINNRAATSAALNEGIFRSYFWIKLDRYNELTQQELMDIINIEIARSNNNKCKKVIQLSKNNEFIKEYNSIADAAKEVKCTKQAIQQCVSGKCKTCKGYKWKYK